MGAASGRVDALVFMAGLIAGVLVFAEAYAGLAAVLVVIALGTLWLVAKLEPSQGAGRES